MELKEYLASIGIKVANNEEANDFLLQPHISSYLSQEWAAMAVPTLPDETKDIDIADEAVETEMSDTVQVVTADEAENNQPDENITDKTETMGVFTNDNNPMGEAEKQKISIDVFATRVQNSKFSLLNGRVDQAYSFQINPDILDACQIGYFSFSHLEEIGLSFNAETHTIEGVPTQAGNYTIQWQVKGKNWSEDMLAITIGLNIVINPDPKSLWNNIPTPSDIPFYKNDCDKEYLKVEAEKRFLRSDKRKKDMVAASQRGRSHAHEGKARDDDFKLHYDATSDWYTIVVADGAGSAKYSRRGAEVACDTVIDICSTLISESQKPLENIIEQYNKESSAENRKGVGDALYKILGSAVFKAYKNIQAEAENSSSAIKDFSTTLLISIAKEFKFGWFIASFWVGDGGIGIYSKDKPYLKVMGESDGGEFAGQTRFLTMAEIMQPEEIYNRLRFDIVDDFTALILMTDGITDPKFETDSNLLKIEKWDAMWNDLNQQVDFDEENTEIDSQLLKWLDFWSPGNHDDRTIAILF